MWTAFVCVSTKNFMAENKTYKYTHITTLAVGWFISQSKSNCLQLTRYISFNGKFFDSIYYMQSVNTQSDKREVEDKLWNLYFSTPIYSCEGKQYNCPNFRWNCWNPAHQIKRFDQMWWIEKKRQAISTNSQIESLTFFPQKKEIHRSGPLFSSRTIFIIW